MKPGEFPLDIYRGDTYRWQFVLWSDIAKTQPVDLSGVLVKSQIRDKPMGRLLAVIDCTVTPPNTILATLTAAECAKLVGRTLAWDLQLAWANGDITTLLAGPVNLTIDVTDSLPEVARPVLATVKASV